MNNNKMIADTDEGSSYALNIDRLRKVPTQHRAIQTVEVILAAAVDIIRSHGLESACTTKIAERAGVPVGAVYRYFKDMSAIEAELIVRGLKHLEHETISIHRDLYVDPERTIDIASDVDKATDAILAFYGKAEGPASILPIMQTSHLYRDINLAFNNSLGEQLARIFEEASVPFPPSKMRHAAITVVKIGSAMQDLVWSTQSAEDQGQYIIEWKRAVTAYLSDLSTETSSVSSSE